jgi:hypothetical protein
LRSQFADKNYRHKDKSELQHPNSEGGALLEEMRQLVRSWNDAQAQELEEIAVRSNVLNKTTRARAADILRRVYIPRFVEGPIPNAWKMARYLEDQNALPAIVRPVYYWISAKAEPLIFDFVTEYLLTRIHSARAGVSVEDVLVWLNTKDCQWSSESALKVARGLLAALRDFGILEGGTKKRLATRRLPNEAFAYLAFCFHGLGSAGRQLVFHADWQLFLLQIPEVEHEFLEAHQRRLLEYHAAGSTISISFPCRTLEEYARVVVERSN